MKELQFLECTIDNKLKTVHSRKIYPAIINNSESYLEIIQIKIVNSDYKIRVRYFDGIIEREETLNRFELNRKFLTKEWVIFVDKQEDIFHKRSTKNTYDTKPLVEYLQKDDMFNLRLRLDGGQEPNVGEPDWTIKFYVNLYKHINDKKFFFTPRILALLAQVCEYHPNNLYLLTHYNTHKKHERVKVDYRRMYHSLNGIMIPPLMVLKTIKQIEKE